MLQINAKENAVIEVVDGYFPLGQRNTIKINVLDEAIKAQITPFYTGDCEKEKDSYSYGSFSLPTDINYVNIKNAPVGSLVNIVDGYGRNSSRCLHYLTVEDNNGYIELPPDKTNVVKDNKYVFSGYIKVTKGTTIVSSDYFNLQYTANTDKTENDWVFIRKEFTATTNYDFSLKITNDTNTECYIDTVKLFLASDEIVSTDNTKAAIKILSPYVPDHSIINKEITWSFTDDSISVYLYVDDITVVNFQDDILCKLCLYQTVPHIIEYLGDYTYNKEYEIVYDSEEFVLNGYIIPVSDDTPNKDAVAIKNKNNVIFATINTATDTATKYIQDNYSRNPTNYDSLFITLTDLNNIKVLYTFSDNEWLYTDLTKFVSVFDQNFTEEEKQQARNNIGATSTQDVQEKVEALKTDLVNGTVIPAQAVKATKDAEGNVINTTYVTNVKHNEDFASFEGAITGGNIIAGKAKADAEGNTINTTYATKAEVEAITAVQIRNKDEVIPSTEAEVQTIATDYIRNNYNRDPQNWDGLILTITDKDNDKILYIYSEASSLWINSGINGVDLTDYVSVNEQQFTDDQKQQARKNIDAATTHIVTVTKIDAGFLKDATFVEIENWVNNGENVVVKYSITLQGGGTETFYMSLVDLYVGDHFDFAAIIPDTDKIIYCYIEYSEYCELYEETYLNTAEQKLTKEQQEQVRKNIGAGTSDFSGSYNDLMDRPALEAGKGYLTVQSMTPLTNEVTGTYGIALGGSNRVNALYGFTHGTLNKIAEGADKGVGIGTRNIVKGNTGIALGRDNNANSKGALALGNNATADGEASAALGGYNTLAKKDYQVAIGTNNAPNEEASVIIGAGNKNARQNVATFRKDGSMTLGGKFVKSVFNNTHKAIGYWDVPKSNESSVQLNTRTDYIIGIIKGLAQNTETGWRVYGVNNAGGIRAQMLIRQAPRTAQGKDWPVVQIEKGKRYKFYFEALKYSGSFEEDINFWLTADNSTICYTSTQQKDDALLYESGHIKINSNNWTKVTIAIDKAAHSGNLRLGICGVELNYESFIIRNIKIWEDPDDGVAVYHYKSYGSDINKDPNGAVDKYLYKIGDCQAIDNAQWLRDNRNLTEFNTNDPEADTTFINTNAYSPTTEYGDARNYYGGSQDDPLIVCVDRIVPYKHDVLERGIYVDPTIFTVDYDEWVDSLEELATKSSVDILTTKVNQNTTDISNKLDKVTTEGSTRLYSIGADGSQNTIEYATDKSGAIVQRKANGAISTPTPIDNAEAANKQYVDNKIKEFSNENIIYEDTRNLYTTANILTQESQLTLAGGATGTLASGISLPTKDSNIALTFTQTGLIYVKLTMGSDLAGNNLAMQTTDGLQDLYNGTRTIEFVENITNTLTFICTSTKPVIINAIEVCPVVEENTTDATSKIIKISSTLYKNNKNDIYGFYNTILNNESKPENSTRNIVLGYSALKAISVGHRNVALGTFSLSQATDTNNTIAIGSDSMLAVKNSNGNIAIGKASMYAPNKATNNIAIGLNSLYSKSSATISDNIAIGNNSGYYTTANYNIFIGRSSGYNNTTGYLNIGIGSNALKYNKTGIRNIAIGSTADVADGKKDTIVIGNDAKATKDYQVVIQSASTVVPEVIIGDKKFTFTTDNIAFVKTADDTLLTLSAGEPTEDSHLTTKKYVDGLVGNINTILATMFNDVSTQSDEEPTNDETVIEEVTE